MATLAANIDASQTTITISGDASAAAKSKLYAINDEIVQLEDFGTYPNIVGGTSPGDYPDRSTWKVKRGQWGSTPASHSSGDAVVAVSDAFLRSASLTDPAPLRTLSGAVLIEIKGGGSAIATGVHGELRLPFAGSWTKATILSDQDCSAVVDLWLDSYANYPPTDADSITAAAPPTLSTADTAEDTTLTGWTTAFAAGDCLRWNVDSNDVAERLVIVLEYDREI